MRKMTGYEIAVPKEWENRLATTTESSIAKWGTVGVFGAPDSGNDCYGPWVGIYRPPEGRGVTDAAALRAFGPDYTANEGWAGQETTSVTETDLAGGHAVIVAAMSPGSEPPQNDFWSQTYFASPGGVWIVQTSMCGIKMDQATAKVLSQITASFLLAETLPKPPEPPAPSVPAPVTTTPGLEVQQVATVAYTKDMRKAGWTSFPVATIKNVRGDAAALVQLRYLFDGKARSIGGDLLPMNVPTSRASNDPGALYVLPGTRNYVFLMEPRFSFKSAEVEVVSVTWLPAKTEGFLQDVSYAPSGSKDGCVTTVRSFVSCSFLNPNPYPIRVQRQLLLSTTDDGYKDVRVVNVGKPVLLAARARTKVAFTPNNVFDQAEYAWPKLIDLPNQPNFAAP